MTPNELKRLRLRAGLTQQQLADLIPFGRGGQVTVSRIEAGEIAPTRRTVNDWVRICRERIAQNEGETR